jgi:hypothetical protein
MVFSYNTDNEFSRGLYQFLKIGASYKQNTDLVFMVFKEDEAVEVNYCYKERGWTYCVDRE